ncbi:SRPBCC domain-containing protein [Caenimonas terrae]|uniref:SRPBCC domain-containing protein n=1 Tax=Caenimonas terrae TaxID=696074 RepID=A0ABW0NI22_9BURK
MDHFRRQLVLSAPAADVYQALATQQGLQGWWTQSCEADGHAGGRATFRFGQTRKVMRIDRLEPGREVRWHCIESHIAIAGVPPDEWRDTQIVFRLTPRGAAQTVLDFEHIGLTPALACWGACNKGWDHFLGSLRSLVESGEGAPYLPSVSASCGGAATAAAASGASAALA